MTEKEKPNVFLQFDTDKHASSFDSIVAADSGADQVLTFADVEPVDVSGLVHGAMFTRSPRSIHKTMIFLGGSDYEKAKANFAEVQKTLFPPFQNSVLFDPSGCNTTATAAVLSALSHVRTPDSQLPSESSLSFSNWIEKPKLSSVNALVFGATGPVGSCVCRLLAKAGVSLTVCSRTLEKANRLKDRLLDDSKISINESEISAAENEVGLREAATNSFDLIFSCGAPAVCIVSDNVSGQILSSRAVLVDLNAVPPAGIAGVQAADNGKITGESLCYGPIGVGNLKMKIHQNLIRECFRQAGRVFDLMQIFDFSKAFI